MIDSFHPAMIIGAGDLSILDEIGNCKADLIVLPGETVPESAIREGLRIHRAPTIGQACLAVRGFYSQHIDIVTLGSLRWFDAHPIAPELESIRKEWSAAVSAKLSEAIDDLGNDPIDTWIGAKHALENMPKLLRSRNAEDLSEAHANRPAICVASGPSASAAIAQVRRLQPGAIIFAADSIAGGLLDAGIAPDYVCLLERDESIKHFVDREWPEQTWLIAPPVIHPSSSEPFGDRVVWWWSGDHLCRWIDAEIPAWMSGRSAGTLTVAAAILARCNPIYLVGHDLCYAPDRSHAELTHDLAKTSQVRDDASDNHYLRKFMIRSDDGGVVQTNALWNAFKGDIEIMAALNPWANIVKCSDMATAEMVGIPRGSMPESLEPLARKPIQIVHRITQRPGLKASILKDVARIERELTTWNRITDMTTTAAGCDKIAQGLQVEALVSSANVPFFWFVFRSIYHAMMLRMHLRAKHNDTTIRMRKDNYMILIKTLETLCRYIRRDLA